MSGIAASNANYKTLTITSIAPWVSAVDATVLPISLDLATSADGAVLPARLGSADYTCRSTRCCQYSLVL